jgi:MFS family permease
VAVAPFSGSLSDRIGTRAPACFGAALCALSLFLMSRLPDSAGPADVAWRLALFGLGTGIFQSPNTSAVMGSVPKPNLGIASGVLATVRNVGMVLGIATGGAILYASVSPHVLEQGMVAGPAAAGFLQGLEHAYLAGAVFTGAASVTSIIRWQKMVIK